MKNIILSMIFASFALASTNEVKPINSAPTGVDLVKFPILKEGGLTIGMTADLKLIPVRLDRPITVYNHFRSDGSWRIQTLLKDDLVYKDQETGEIRYRAFCSNRVVVVKNCPTHVQVPAETPIPSWLDDMIDKFASAWRTSTGNVGTAWGMLLPIVGFLLLPLAAGGWWLYRRLRPVPTTAPPPAPPAATAPAPYRRSPGTGTPSSPPSPLGRNQKM